MVIAIVIVRKTKQCVVVQVTNLADGAAYTPIAVYGLHANTDKKLWLDLRSIMKYAIDPYIIIGVLHAVNQTTDRINGALVSEVETVDFTKFVMDVGIMETPWNGGYYSWNNIGTRDNKISSRIDKAFTNDLMIHKYPNLMVQYLPGGISDHTPLVVSFCATQDEGGRPFRFNNILS